MNPRFADITERSDEPATPGQIADIFSRYRWASGHCEGRRVLEVACGTGQGLGLLARGASSVIGCDIEERNIARARETYGSRFELHVGPADRLPVGDGAVDVVLICEALYYLPDVGAFLDECRRVLPPTGVLLLTTTNPDLFDFLPSPLSHRYYGAADLGPLLERHGFDSELLGYHPTGALPLRHRLLRPVKVLASRLGLLPKTMRGKALLRRLVFGRLPPMPRDLAEVSLPRAPLYAIAGDRPDRLHRSVYVVARRHGAAG
jgi:SAM-dependent methyltransferase